MVFLWYGEGWHLKESWGPFYPLKWNQDPRPRLHYCFLGCLSIFLAALPFRECRSVTLLPLMLSHFSRVRLFMTSQTATPQASGSFTISGSLFKLMSSLWCHATISSSTVPFYSCLQSLPASESFSRSWLFASGGQSIGASATASVLPMNIQGWGPLFKSVLWNSGQVMETGLKKWDRKPSAQESYRVLLGFSTSFGSSGFSHVRRVCLWLSGCTCPPRFWGRNLPYNFSFVMNFLKLLTFHLLNFFLIGKKNNHFQAIFISESKLEVKKFHNRFLINSFKYDAD